jgi:hypothetical protein
MWIRFEMDSTDREASNEEPPWIDGAVRGRSLSQFGVREEEEAPSTPLSGNVHPTAK